MRQSKKILTAAILTSLLSGLYAVPVMAEEITGQQIVINTGETKPAIVEGSVSTTKMSGNRVTIKEGGASTSNVIAAWNDKGGSHTAADDNHVTIEAGTTEIDRYVAGADVTGDAANNTVTIHDRFVRGEVLGGQSHKGDANNNKVTITGENAHAYFVRGGSTPYNGKGDTNNNTIEIDGGTYDYDIIGGSTDGGNSNGNKVTLKDASVQGWAIGGKSAYGTANDNEVNISGAKTVIGSGGVWTNVYGGYSNSDTANGNKVNISGGTIHHHVYGGEGVGSTDHNEITISGGKITGSVYGGAAFYGAAASSSHNTIKVTGGEIAGNVIGGYAADGTSGNVSSSNTIEIENAAVNGYVFGGYTKKGSTTNNTVTLKKGAKFGAQSSIWGGTTNDFSGNTLTIDGAKDITVSNVYLFENYNFYLPAGTKTDDTILHLTTSDDTDMRNTNVYVKANGAVDLHNQEKVYLVKKDGGQLLDEGMTKKADVLVGVTAQLKGEVTKDDNDLILTINSEEPLPPDKPDEPDQPDTPDEPDKPDQPVEPVKPAKPDKPNKPEINPNTKSLVETRAAQSAMLNRGADLLVDQTLRQVARTIAETDGTLTFATVEGTNNLRFATGSHISLNGYHWNVGAAKVNEGKKGKFTWGPFFENGDATYDSFLANGVHGSGDTSYVGGGLFGRQDYRDGLYVEASLRGGRTKASYDSSDLGKGFGTGSVLSTSFDTDALYLAGHLGVGKVFRQSAQDSLDVYGKYLYSYTGSDDARLSSGETYHFDGVDSHRLRVGLRYIHAVNEKSKGYLGAAYQYEFKGDARAHYQGLDLASPSLKGSSGMFEGGWILSPSKDSPVNFDLGVTGWVGTQKGITFHAGVNYKF